MFQKNGFLENTEWFFPKKNEILKLVVYLRDLTKSYSKKVTDSSIFEKHDFWANFRKKIMTILSVNSTFFKLETQNQNVKWITKTVIKKLKLFRTRCFFIQAVLQKLQGL